MRKYIDMLGITFDKTPQGFCYEESLDLREGTRGALWAKERELNGFDERETWSLDSTIELFLYERLSLFRDVANKEVLDENIDNTTLGDYIDKMIDGLKILLLTDIWSDEWKNIDIVKRADDAFLILSKHIDKLKLPNDKIYLSNEYIDWLGLENISSNFLDNDEKTQKLIRKKEREIFTFDSSELNDLEHTFKLFLCFRLMMYDYVNNVDTECTEIDFNGKTISLQDCLDFMIEGLRFELNPKNQQGFDKDYIDKRINEVFEILRVSIRALWW